MKYWYMELITDFNTKIAVFKAFHTKMMKFEIYRVCM
jgi:hypothetical protein